MALLPNDYYHLVTCPEVVTISDNQCIVNESHQPCETMTKSRWRFSTVWKSLKYVNGWEEEIEGDEACNWQPLLPIPQWVWTQPVSRVFKENSGSLSRIALRKWNYSVCCLRDVFLIPLRHLPNSIQNISISGVQSWPSIFAEWWS